MTTRLIRPLLALLALAAWMIPAPAFAYWEYGHETIAEIAMANVKPSTRAAVLELLRHEKLLDTPACPAKSIEDASIWPDCVKKLGDRFKYAFAWHYQDVDVCRPFALKPACKDGNCVSAQIERDVALLKDRRTPEKERVTALVFLIHFVGDLHQPLHAGERGDAGGNKVGATYGSYTSARFNLHSIWDGPLAERAITTGPSLVHRYPAAERAKLQAGTVTDWSRESWQVAHDAVYASALHGDPCGPEPAHVTLSEADIEKLVPVARLQVKRAGLRLAKLLDQVFS